MRVTVFHNVTREDGHLAIFSRFDPAPRIAPGDQLQRVGSFSFPDAASASPQGAAELAFAAGNSPYATEYVREYRSWHVRSLCAGDVVVVEDDKHDSTTLGCETFGWSQLNLGDFMLHGAVIISLKVENTYELYESVTTTVTDVVVSAPPADVTSEAYDTWVHEQIIDPYTGTGRTDGDAWYDVTVTACSDPTLVGRTFNWGY